jgi:pilus assembly protein CpaB
MEKTRQRGIVFMAIAAILALIGGCLFFAYLNTLKREIGETVEVVVAKVDIPPRTLITADMLEMQKIPQKYARASYIASIDDVLPEFVTLVKIEKGDFLQRNTIATYAGLKPGMRAISIGVNRIQSIGGSIRPGNRVDVIVSFEEEGEAKTLLLLQNVEVLAVSMLMPVPAEEGIGAVPPARFSPTGELLSEATVTLALTLEDAVKLTYMDNFAKEVRFIIRRLDEEKVIPTPTPVTFESFKKR